VKLQPFHKLIIHKLKRSTRQDGQIGHYAREIGGTTYSHTARAKNWFQKEITTYQNSRSTSNGSQAGGCPANK
jgi:hypothetical protein